MRTAPLVNSFPFIFQAVFDCADYMQIPARLKPGFRIHRDLYRVAIFNFFVQQKWGWKTDDRPLRAAGKFFLVSNVFWDYAHNQQPHFRMIPAGLSGTRKGRTGFFG
jgi:hypothetical protein